MFLNACEALNAIAFNRGMRNMILIHLASESTAFILVGIWRVVSK
jgi:hypothetical protein